MLAKFYESVFVKENDSVPHNLQPRPCQSLFRDPIYSEKIILEKLNSLKVSKSPGPDNTHPQILYELRNEIVQPLKMLFETSYKLNQLPADWKSAIFKKVTKAIHLTIDPSVLPVLFVK